MTEKGKIETRVMTEADIDFGMKLKNLAKWNQIPADWKRFIDLEPQGCFVAATMQCVQLTLSSAH